MPQKLWVAISQTAQSTISIFTFLKPQFGTLTFGTYFQSQHLKLSLFAISSTVFWIGWIYGRKPESRWGINFPFNPDQTHLGLNKSTWQIMICMQVFQLFSRRSVPATEEQSDD